MTPDDLEELVLESSKAKAVERAFADMPEKERAKLSTTAQQLHNQLNRGKPNAKASKRLTKLLAKRKGEVWNHWHKPDTQRALLAVFACGPLTAVKSKAFTSITITVKASSRSSSIVNQIGSMTGSITNSMPN